MSKKKEYWNWILLAVVVGYFLFPVDIIPDALPIIGWADDIVIAIIAWKLKS